MPIIKLPKIAFIPLDLPDDIPAQQVQPKRCVRVVKPSKIEEPVPEVKETLTQDLKLPKTYGMTKARALKILGEPK